MKLSILHISVIRQNVARGLLLRRPHARQKNVYASSPAR